jgi:hypothetical protein
MYVYIYIYIYIYIYEPRKKTYLQSLYKYTHPIFYGSRFATEERRSRLPPTSLYSECLPAHGRVWASVVFCCRAQRLIIWLLQWEAVLSFGIDDGTSTQPRRKFYLVFFFFKYMYVQCGWTAVVNQLLHIKKRKMALPSLVHLPALGWVLVEQEVRLQRETKMKRQRNKKENRTWLCWFLGLCVKMIFLMVL